MRLAEAVSLYVRERRSGGSPFVSSERTLNLFAKHCGEIALEQVSPDLVRSFVEQPRCSPITRVSKFSAVKCLVDYFAVRGAMPVLLLVRPAKPRDSRVPFIFSTEQIRSLLVSTDRCQPRTKIVSASTLKVSVLLLYATGCTVTELLNLRPCDVDLVQQTLELRSSFHRPGRIIPIGDSLLAALDAHMAVQPADGGKAALLCDAQGHALRRAHLLGRFKRLLKISGVGSGSAGRTARLQDFRFTFAVHRLKFWIEAGKSLDVLLPPLAAYMGYAGLTRTEEFLAHVPERFREDLEKLSPSAVTAQSG